ncbi:MAG: TolC family protein [Planctomycetota bacterium]|nr:TolC family protein [Planctomycetota bacterium]
MLSLKAHISGLFLLGQKLALTFAICFAGSGCATSDHAKADRAGEEIVQEVLAQVRQGILVKQQGTLPLESVSINSDVPVLNQSLSLEDTLRLSTLHNRNYISQRESLFQSALALGVTRRDFLRPVFSGSISSTLSGGSGQEVSSVSGLSLNGQQYLFTGGRLSVGVGSNLNDDGESLPEIYSGNFSASISQPLLRGAGPGLPYEGLTQAERNLLYTTRSFELFRQDFAIQITQKFYDLLSQKKKLQNAEENVRGQQFAYDQAKALFRIGTGSSLDVFRAEQALLLAKNDQSNTVEQYKVALDNFKIDLGIPIESEIDLTGEFPAISEASFVLEDALLSARENRLDLQTSRDQLEDVERQLDISRNGLLPDLNLNINYGSDSSDQFDFNDLELGDSESYSVGLNLEIPLDRLARRNSFRNAEIALDREVRSFDLKSQQVTLEVQGALRQLAQLKFQIEIGERSIQSFSSTVEKAEIDQLRGTVTNRDVVEAQSALTDAKNAQLDRIVDHEIQLLELYKLMGLLLVSEEGMIVQ